MVDELARSVNPAGMSPGSLPALIIAEAILRRLVSLNWRPSGPSREERNGGASPSARLGGGASGLSTSGSCPDRPLRLVSTNPSPSMKKLSVPCCIDSFTFPRGCPEMLVPKWYGEAETGPRASTPGLAPPDPRGRRRRWEATGSEPTVSVAVAPESGGRRQKIDHPVRVTNASRAAIPAVEFPDGLSAGLHTQIVQ